MQWSKHFEDLLGIKSIVWIAAGIQIAIWLGAKIGEWLAKKNVSHKQQLFAGQLFIAVSAFTAGLWLSPVWIVVFFMLHEVGRGLQRPVRLAYINSHIQSKERATLLSFDGMVSRVGAAFGLLVSGWLAHNWSINLSWQMSAVAIGLFTLLLLRLPNGR